MSRHTIVIIGASFGGLPTAHTLLKDLLPSTGKDYKVVLINPSEEFFWKVGAPRAITRPNVLPLSKALLNFVPTFKAYGDKFEFVKGHATAIDETAHTVQVDTSTTIRYDQLVIASGTYFENDIWSTTSGVEALTREIKSLHEKLPAAQSILVAGGGPAGVETAGELGEEYGLKKSITLLSGGERLLGRLTNQKPGDNAQRMLGKMGIKVEHGIQVKSHENVDGKEVLHLSNGETRTVDVYISATGDKPNSSFVPKAWLDNKNKVKTDEHTLRVEGVPNVYAIGSIASFSDGSIMDTKMAYKACAESVKLDFLNQQPGARTKNVYKKLKGEFAFVPVGSAQGVGVAFGYGLPSFVIKMTKSKDFMIGDAPKLIQGNF